MTRREFTFTAVAAAAASARASTPKPTLCFFSKHLQDMNYDQVGKALRDAGFDGVDLTVRPKGHVLPERVAEDLPRAYEAIRSHALQVPMISTELLSASDPAARPTLQTAARLGIPYFKVGYYKWTNDLDATLANVRSSLRGLVELAKEYGITAGLHNHVGYVGQTVWEVQPIIASLDAKRLGYYYDFHHTVSQSTRNSWEVTLRLAAPRLKMVATKDFNWAKRDKGWQTESCPLGRGAVDWARAFAHLGEIRFAGPLSIHQEYKAEDRLAAAHADLQFVKQQIAKAYA